MIAVSIAWRYHLSFVATTLVLGLVAVLVVWPLLKAARDVLVAVLLEEPPADVLGEVDAGEYRSTVRGMQ